MRILCTTCERTFDADDVKAAGVDQVSCVCGARLLLRRGMNNAYRMGRYTLVNQIAAGATGEVWFALMDGVQGFVKETVVKRLAPTFANDSEAAKRLVKEARISALMNHPNVAEVYDLIHEEGRYALVMEYVPGIPLSDFLQATQRTDVQLPTELGVVVVAQLLRALDHAHHLTRQDQPEAFIHRSISPQNLLITEDARLKVIDFGMARARGEASQTAPGIVHGKLCYQTPERLLGASADEQTDLFPAAIILYECWAMRALFRGATLDETLQKIHEARVPAMSQWRSDVSPALERVMRRGLSFDPAERFPNAKAFLDALLEACAPVPFESMRATTAAFLHHHTTLLFAPLHSHKRSPGKLPEITRKLLRDAGEAPAIEHILRRPAVLKGAAQAPEAAMRRPHERLNLVAAAITIALLGATAAAMTLWHVDASPLRSSQPQVAPMSAQPETLMAAPPSTQPGPSASLPETDTARSSTLHPTTPPVPVPTAASRASEDLQSEPKANELNHLFQAHSERLLSCFESSGADRYEELHIKIAPDGTVTALLESEQLGPAAPCVQATLKRLRFRKFLGPAIEFLLPLNITTRQQR